MTLDDARNGDVGVVLEVLPYLAEHLRLAVVVHLLANRAGELVGEVFEREGACLPDESHDERERPADDPKVGFDQVLDSGASDLHRDLFAVDLRVVHLSEARAAYRLGVELVEVVRHGAEFGLDDLLRVRPRRWRHLVLQFREFVHVLGRKDVGTRREELSEFDERRTEREERLEERVRPFDSHLARHPA